MKKVVVKPKLLSALTPDKVAIAIKAAILIFAIGAVFFQDLAIIFKDALQTETTSYILSVPFLLAYLVYRKRKINANIYQKLSTSNKQIIDAVFETQKSTTATLRAIATTYKNRIGETIEEEKLLHKISEIEKTGIIKSDIANNQDEPTRIWKTQLALRKNFKIRSNK